MEMSLRSTPWFAPVSISLSGGTVITRVPVPSTASETRRMVRGSTSATATISTPERVCSRTEAASCSVPMTGTEEIRRCFLAGSSSSRATGRKPEAGSCIMRCTRNVPSAPAPKTTTFWAWSPGLAVDSWYMRLR